MILVAVWAIVFSFHKQHILRPRATNRDLVARARYQKKKEEPVRRILIQSLDAMATGTLASNPFVGEHADADSDMAADEDIPTFYIGQHESKRPLPVTDFVLRQAQDVGVCDPSDC